MTDNNADKFEARWNSYVDDLTRLRLAANDEDAERLKEIQAELGEIVERTAEESRGEARP